MDVAAAWRLGIIFTIKHWSHFFVETPFGHHVACHLGSPLNIIGCTGGYAINTANQFFSNTATKQTA